MPRRPKSERAPVLHHELPTGAGGERLKDARILANALEVKNEVLWVNPAFELPFDIEKGKSTPFGRFLVATGGAPSPWWKHIEISAGHGRSALLGRVIFRDREGRLYRDVDLKGIGFVDDQGGLEVRTTEEDVLLAGRSETGPVGFVLRGYAEHDRDMSEVLLRNGIRTYRVVAILALKELVVDRIGSVKTIAQAKKAGVLQPDDEPVVEVRAWGTRARVEDTPVLRPWDPSFESEYVYKRRIKHKWTLLWDAIALVEQEFGWGNKTEGGKTLSRGQRLNRYRRWFGRTLRKQVRRLHRIRHAHGYLSPHNVTLDCRIVDLDSVYAEDDIDITDSGFKLRQRRDRGDISRVIDRLGLSVDDFTRFEAFLDDDRIPQK